MKISDAISSAFSLTRGSGNLRIARSGLIRSAHLLERIGLAAVGASCGLYVGAALLREKGGLFESGWIVLITMLYGALSYYVGIDLSRSVARKSISSNSEEWNGSESAEIMSAAGTFGAAIAATLSVSILVLDQNPANGLITFVAGCWVVGSSLQVAAGMMARNYEARMEKKGRNCAHARTSAWRHDECKSRSVGFDFRSGVSSDHSSQPLSSNAAGRRFLVAQSFASGGDPAWKPCRY